MKKFLLSAAASGVLSLGAATWSNAVALRCDFEGPLPAGVKAVGKFISVPGVHGKGGRFNRPAWSAIARYAEKPTAAGAVAVCPSLTPGQKNCVSFSACGKGKVTLTIRSGKLTQQHTVNVDSAKWQLYTHIFTVPEKLATITFKAENLKWRNPQVTRAWALPAAWTPPGKVFPGCFLEIDPAKGYLNLDKGAFALWVKTPYLNSDMLMSHIGIFGIDHARKPIKRHPDQQILCMTAWNGARLHAYRLPLQGNSVNLSYPLKELQFGANEWHLIVLNWERKGKDLALELLFDDGKIKLRSVKPYGKDKKIWRITAAYSDYAYLNGDADDLVFFKRPLTAAEVKGLFEARGNWK